MSAVEIIGMVSIIVAGLTITLGSIGPALAQGRAITQALAAMAQQPDEAGTIARTLFVGLAMIESLAIYCLVAGERIIFAPCFAASFAFFTFAQCWATVPGFKPAIAISSHPIACFPLAFTISWTLFMKGI